MNPISTPSTAADLDRMHAIYREGGADRATAPHVVYVEAGCPHTGCSQHLQAIDFRLEAFGRSDYDSLVKAWWDDTGFAAAAPVAVSGSISRFAASAPSATPRPPRYRNCLPIGPPRP